VAYGIRDATKVIFLTSADNGLTWEPSTEFSALELDNPVAYSERDAERVIVLTSLDGGTTWVPADVTGGVSDDPWVTFVPEFTATTTDPVIGTVNGFCDGKYQTLGKVVVVQGHLQWGDFVITSGAYSDMGATYASLGPGVYADLFGGGTPSDVGSGTYSLVLPTTDAVVNGAKTVGVWHARQAATGDIAFGPIVITDVDKAQFMYGDNYPVGVESFIDDSGLFAWADGDELSWSFTYELV
jgi:hypothetical protein